MLPAFPGIRVRTSPRTVCVLVLVLASLLSAVRAADHVEPLVARVQLELKVEDEIIGKIEKGDLLTPQQERDDAYLVVTHNGATVWIGKHDVAELTDSVEIYNDLLNSESGDPRLYTLRASAWWARGDIKRALGDYDRAIQSGYDEPHVYISRGMFHAASGSYDKAIADYDSAIQHGGLEIRRSRRSGNCRTSRSAIAGR